MRSTGYILFIFLLVLLTSECFAQRTSLMQLAFNKEEADSILNVIAKTNAPKEKVLLYKELTWRLRNTNAEELALEFANKGIELAREIGFKKAEADIIRFKGMITWNFLHQNITFDLYKQSLQLARDIGDKEGEAYCYDRLGITYYYTNNFSLAEENLDKAIKLFLKLNNKEGLGYVYNHYNWLYTSKHQFEKAIQAAKKSYEVRMLVHDYTGVSNAISDLGLTFAELNKVDSAIFYQQKAVTIDREKALSFNLAIHAGLLSELYLKVKDYSNALLFAKESLQKAESNNIKRQVLKTAGIIAEIYEQQKVYPKALEFYHLHQKLKDSLFSDDISRKIVQQEMKYDYDKQKQAKENKDKIERLVLTSIIIIISIVAFIIFLGRKRKQKDNEQLQLKNIEINNQKEEIARQAIELQELNKMKNALFSVISHDLRTPVSTTLTLLEMLNDETLSEEEFTVALPRLIEQLKQTSGLLDNLLLWSRSLINGKAAIKKDFDFSQITNTNLDLIAVQLKSKHISVVNYVTKPLLVAADMSMIDVVLRNLLSNAVKFCEPGDQISITSNELHEFVQINVEDTGVGIAKEKIAFIFEPKTNTTRGTANEVGTGLGLLLCKEFVERNGGRIWVESEAGKGTTFHFTVPKPEGNKSVCKRSIESVRSY